MINRQLPHFFGANIGNEIAIANSLGIEFCNMKTHIQTSIDTVES